MAAFQFTALALALVTQLAAAAKPQGNDKVLNSTSVSASKPNLRKGVKSVLPTTVLSATNKTQQPCQCMTTSPSWTVPQRTTTKCIFIDLGAADGNSFQRFLNNDYGPVANCPYGGDWEAFLVEANPLFNHKLQAVQSQYPNKVHALPATAAYMCEAHTSFYLDTTSHAQNYWGSSMNKDVPDVQKSGEQKVTVPTLNLMRLIHEHTLKGDWVIVKMDIEGTEWDVLPCLAKSPEAYNIDRMFLEDHYHLGNQLGLAGTLPADYEAAKAQLRSMHVDIPQYFSHQF